MVYGEGEMKYRVRIEFTVPKLVSLETTLGPITKFLKVFEQKMREKYRKIIFPTFCCLIQKLDHNSSLHAKNQREISIVTKSEGFFGLKEGENAGIGEEMV